MRPDHSAVCTAKPQDARGRRPKNLSWLPAYAPKLNPVEECWNHTKYAHLPNFIPDDLDHLQTAVCESMLEQREDQTLMRSFFPYAKLPL